MQRRDILWSGVTLVALLLGGSAIYAARADNAQAGKTLAGNATVNIDNFSFTPAAITIAAGTKISWNNRDDIPHTITDAAEQRAFKSAPLDTGDAFAFVFSKAGTYHYFCSLHPHMQGTVVVQ
jgi:plastocyanin